MPTVRRKVAADDHELFMQQQTRNAEAYARKIKDVRLGFKGRTSS